MKKIKNNKVLSILIALAMILTVFPQAVFTAEAATDATKLVINYNGQDIKITESQWNDLYNNQKETHSYSGLDRSGVLASEEFTGVKLTTVLEFAGVPADKLTDDQYLNFKASDGYVQSMKAGEILNRELYEFTDEAGSDPVNTVPTIISDRGRLIIGQCEKNDYNKFKWVNQLFGGNGSGISLAPNGSEACPYIISNEQELRSFSDNINQGKDADKAYILTSDINLQGKEWSPAGSAGKPFKGIFDGNGKTISGLFIEKSRSYLGLFGYSKGTIKNLKVSGTVRNTAEAPSEEHGSADFIGGIVGFNAGTVEDVDAQVSVIAPAANNVGGIAGLNTSGNWIEVTASDEDVKHSVAGATGSILRSANSGIVVGRMKTGGITGENAGTIESTYNVGTVVNTKTYGGSGVGGIAGRNGNNNAAYETGIIRNCYNGGTVILDCYGSGTDASGKWGGGISGFVNSISTIENSYTYGMLDVNNAYDDWAAICPKCDAGATLSNNYSLEGLPLCDKLSEMEDHSRYTGTVLSADSLKSTETAAGLGSEFKADTENINSGYPVLEWQNSQRKMTAVKPTILYKASISFSKNNYAYTGSEIKPDITVKNNGKTLRENLDYKVKYTNNIYPGTGKVTVTGIGLYKNTLTGSFVIGKVTGLKVKERGTSSVNLSWNSQPKVTGYKIYRYKSGDYTLIKTVKGGTNSSASVGNLTAGTGYKFKVKAYVTAGTATYSGALSDSVSSPTKPARVTLKKLTTGSSHYVKAFWSKKTGSGYQVKLATNAGFTSGVKTYTLNSSNTLSRKITGLKKGKKYYVKVRAFKSYEGTKAYGEYSKTKSIRTK